jgi:uncharacterized YigZ family protein
VRVSEPATADDLPLSSANADRFRPPAGWHHTTELVIKKSRFIATAARTDSETAARQLIAEAQQTHPTARHHCSAFIIIESDGTLATRSSDDGEPAGTAGIPMLTTIDKAKWGNLAVVVTRYFGGIKLGAGGLVRAYTESTSQALRAIPAVIAQTSRLWRITVGFGEAGRVDNDLRNAGGVVHDRAYDADQLVLTVSWPPETDGLAVIDRVTRGQAQVEAAGTSTIEVASEHKFY